MFRAFKHTCFILLALILLPAAVSAAKYPITLKDCRGKAITIAREPRRIVSLTPNNTEILFALGLGSRVVGVNKWSDYPAAARKKPKVGDRTISIEKIIALKPDLVLAHGTLNDAELPGIERRGIPVFAIDPKTIAEVVRDIRLVGRIANREKNAAEIAWHITSAEKSVKRKVSGIEARPKVLVAIQADPLWAAGPKTFIDEMIRLAGGVNLACDAKPGFGQFSAEAAAWRNPDIIIGTNSGDKKVFMNGLWKRSNAARRNRICEANPDLLVRPGPRLADGILLIARMIHPNAFDKRKN
jgi:iron complex transport system substrate-binding protein